MLISVVISFSPTALPNGIHYDADGVTISLSTEVESAIHNGIDLTFICEFALVNRLVFITWTEQLETHRFVVRHHALSNSYLVNEDSSSTPRIFRSTTDALAYLANRTTTLFAERYSPQEPYQMRLRVSKYELPAPMRLSAFITDDWDLNTGWKTWQSAQ